MIGNKTREFFATPRRAQITLSGQQSHPAPISCRVTIKSNTLQVNLTGSRTPMLSAEVDNMASCYCVGVDAVYHFLARIIGIKGERELEMVIMEAISYPQQRRFFRVDTKIALKCWLVQLTDKSDNEAERTRVNLSAVGLRFETTKFLKHGEKVNIEMQLPNESMEVVKSVGMVVRVDFGDDRKVEDVAIDLVEIKPAEQEKLIKFCLAEQRRQIRLKVRVLDPALS